MRFFLLLEIKLFIFLQSSVEKEWGGGIEGFHLSSAVYALVKLGDKTTKVENWRPQLLLCAKLNENNDVLNNSLFDFAQQLKKSKGLTVVTNILKGDYRDLKEELKQTKQVFFMHFL